VTDKNDLMREMVVYDSAIINAMFTRFLEGYDDIGVVASVGDGALAPKAIERNDIDLVLLDIEVPNMDGLTALPLPIKAQPKLVVIMVSSLTERNAEISLRALRMGATDYVTKPSSREALRDADDFKRDLISKVRALGKTGRRRSSGAGKVSIPADGPEAPPKPDAEVVLRSAESEKPRVLAIGSSAGGSQALVEVLKTITQGISLPILITQHMPPTFTAILADHMGQATGWPSTEAKDGKVIENWHIYAAPGGKHLLVQSEGTKKIFRLSDEPPENFCKPAVDPMLRSIAKAYGPSVLAMILTGMGYDGRAGAKVIVECGGTVIAQDKESSVIWGMPGAVATSGHCNAVLPFKDLGSHASKLAA